jgi:hypothetical protein
MVRVQHRFQAEAVLGIPWHQATEVTRFTIRPRLVHGAPLE